MFNRTKYNGAILALDTASAKTGYAIYSNDKIIKSGTWSLKPKIRFADLYNKISNAITKYNITQMVVEDIFKDDSKKNAYEVLAECRGVVECIAQLNELPVFFIRPMVIKRHICNIRYNPAKEYDYKQIMIDRITKLGYKLENQKANDEADAIGLLITYIDTHKYSLVHPK